MRKMRQKSAFDTRDVASDDLRSNKGRDCGERIKKEAKCAGKPPVMAKDFIVNDRKSFYDFENVESKGTNGRRRHV